MSLVEMKAISIENTNGKKDTIGFCYDSDMSVDSITLLKNGIEITTLTKIEFATICRVFLNSFFNGDV